MPAAPSWSGSRSRAPAGAAEGRRPSAVPDALTIGEAMPAPAEKQALSALSQIIAPDLGRDGVSLGMIKAVRISEFGEVGFTFELTTPACPVRDRFKGQAQEVVSALAGVSTVDVKMTANVRHANMRQQASDMLPGVKQTIAVASGKGGVGKSTVAVNLAAALRKSGATVGLLDADIYGPSVPALTGVREQPKVVDQKLVPLRAYGLELMSIGFLGGTEKAMVWRDRKSTRLNSSHDQISYAVFCLKKKKRTTRCPRESVDSHTRAH